MILTIHNLKPFTKADKLLNDLLTPRLKVDTEPWTHKEFTDDHIYGEYLDERIHEES